MPQWRVRACSIIENDCSRRRISYRQLSDAEILLLFWEAFEIRANEMKHLLDRASCILASTSDFPEKADLDKTIKEVLSSLRQLAG